MDGSAVLSKTAKGVDEVTRHAHGLPNRLRSLLIMVNGQATADALIAKVGEAAEAKSSLQYLIDRGFVKDSRLWDAALLKQIETDFTHFVGPIAKIIVRRAQEESSDIEELYAKLADKLELTDERVKFMTTRTRVVPSRPRLRPREAPARAEESRRPEPVRPVQTTPSQRLPGTRPKGALPRPQGKSPSRSRNASPTRGRELLDDIEHQFAQFMGSSAKSIVRLAGKQASSINQLYAMLSRMLDSPRDRLAFIATRRQLYVPLLKRTVARAHGMAGVRPPFPVVAGDGQNGTLVDLIADSQIEVHLEDSDDAGSGVNGNTFFVIDMGTGAMAGDASV